jgi:hypothetical protein
MVSRVDVAQARLVMTIPPTLEIVSGTPGWEGALSADQPQSIDLALRARDAGVFPLFSSLRLTWSPLEFESTDRFITLSTETGEIRVETPNRRTH